MWQRIAILSTALAVFLQAHLPGAEPPATPIWARSDWARLEIVGGRLVVKSSRCGQCRLEEGTEDSSPHATLLVNAQPEAVVVSYERTCDSGRVSLELDEQRNLALIRTDRAGASVRYCQQMEGPVTLEVVAAQSAGVPTSGALAAPSLWHLAIAEPKACREHLFPLLMKLRPDWRLEEQLSEIDTALRAQAGTDVVLRRQAWQTSVDKLTAGQFADRQAADQVLRAAGQPVLPFLRQLDQGRLDREQRLRVRSIIADLADIGPDSPQRVAGWLVDDKQVWLALLSRGDLDQRIAAASHLTQLCRRSLAFDPQASDALRQAQLAQLRAMLAEN